MIVISRTDRPELVCTVLAYYGITVLLVEDVQNAISSLESHAHAFLLLDLAIEGADILLEKVVSNFYNPPPYLLALDTFPDGSSRAKALNLGADACLGKPINPEEVLAVMKAILRRAERVSRPSSIQPVPCIERGELVVDPLRRKVIMRDEPVKLTLKEFEILHLLASYPGIVFSKAQIYELVWKEDYQYSTTSVSDHISSLRRKLGLDARDGGYIQTVFGVGYRFAIE